MFQSNDPLIPFLFDDLESTLRNLLEIILKGDVLKGKSGKQLLDIELSTANRKSFQNITFGVACKAALSKVSHLSFFRFCY